MRSRRGPQPGTVSTTGTEASGRRPTREDHVTTEASPDAATESLPALISVPEAAKLLGLKRASAYRYAAAGELPVKRFGSRVYVIRAQLAELLEPKSATIQEDPAA